MKYIGMIKLLGEHATRAAILLHRDWRILAPKASR